MVASNIIPNSVGTYILIVRLEEDRRIVIGSLGEILFPRGIYAYVGSAMGPGGLRARIMRHLRHEKRKFWHIDFLLGEASIIEVIIIPAPERLECRIARFLIERGVRYVPRFGSSDCRCPSHLFVVDCLEGLYRLLELFGVKYVVFRP